jgi:hypothetical protein
MAKLKVLEMDKPFIRTLGNIFTLDTRRLKIFQINQEITSAIRSRFHFFEPPHWTISPAANAAMWRAISPRKKTWQPLKRNGCWCFNKGTGYRV